MNPFQKLKREAIEQRDSVIRHAREQYKFTLQEIAKLQRRLGGRRPRKFAKLAYLKLGIADEPAGDCVGMTSVQAAKAVLSDGRPRILRELVIEIQTRGHREFDKLGTVTNAVRIGLQYHPELFRLNQDAKWELAPGAMKRKSNGVRTFR